MKAFIQYALVLFCITAVACAILAMVNQATYQVREDNKAEAKKIAQQLIFPDAQDFFEVIYKDTEKDSLVYYEVFDDQENFLGYILNAEGKGYAGKIEIMVGLEVDRSIKMLKVLDQKETPGLGDNCKKDDFPNRYIGRSRDDLTVDKDGGKIDSITGATITTRAITQSIKEYIEKLEKHLPQPIPSDEMSETIEEAL